MEGEMTDRWIIKRADGKYWDGENWTGYRSIAERYASREEALLDCGKRGYPVRLVNASERRRKESDERYQRGEALKDAERRGAAAERARVASWVTDWLSLNETMIAAGAGKRDTSEARAFQKGAMHVMAEIAARVKVGRYAREWTWLPTKAGA